MPICARWWGLKVLFKKKNKLVVLSWALKPTGYLRNTCSHCFPTFSFWSSFLTQTMIILTYYPTHTTIRILFPLGSPFLSFLSIFHSLFAHNIDKHNQKKSFQRTVFSGTPLHILAKVIKVCGTSCNNQTPCRVMANGTKQWNWADPALSLQCSASDLEVNPKSSPTSSQLSHKLCSRQNTTNTPHEDLRHTKPLGCFMWE